MVHGFRIVFQRPRELWVVDAVGKFPARGEGPLRNRCGCTNRDRGRADRRLGGDPTLRPGDRAVAVPRAATACRNARCAPPGRQPRRETRSDPKLPRRRRPRSRETHRHSSSRNHASPGSGELAECDDAGCMGRLTRTRRDAICDVHTAARRADMTATTTAVRTAGDEPAGNR